MNFFVSFVLFLQLTLFESHATSAMAANGPTSQNADRQLYQFLQSVDPSTMTTLLDMSWNPSTSSFTLSPKSVSPGTMVYPPVLPGNVVYPTPDGSGNTDTGTGTDTSPDVSSRTDQSDRSTQPILNELLGLALGFPVPYRPPVSNNNYHYNFYVPSYYALNFNPSLALMADSDWF